MSKPLIVGQITDLHARWAIHGSAGHVDRRSRAVFDLLAQAIAQFKAHKIDLLVVTGDLVDVPTWILEPSDYYHMPIEPWLPLIEADYRRIKAMLDESGLPYVVLPGNHDYEPVMWQVFDRSTNILDIQCADPRRQAGQSTSINHDVPNAQCDEPILNASECRDHSYRVVRFCDREWEDHIPRRFDRERTLWRTMLHDETSPPQIHLQHYVITPTVDDSYPHNYLEAEELYNKTVDSGRVVLSLAGHYHHGSDLLHTANTYFAVGPAFCVFPHSVRIYSVEPDQVQMETIPLCTEPYGVGRPIIFLDRDGVINDLPSYRTGPEAMRLLPGVAQAIGQLKAAGYAVIVVTNQSAVGAGYTSPRIVDMVNDRMCQLMVEAIGDCVAQPDAIMYSIGAGSKAVQPQWTDRSVNKPSPQLLQQAQTLLGLDPTGAWLVGDRLSDLQAARAFGATPILVRTGYGAQSEGALLDGEFNDTHICNDLCAAVSYILHSESRD
ncbi:MAG: HAD-IIIA family hydrolase [Caldilineaceae bacterium]